MPHLRHLGGRSTGAGPRCHEYGWPAFWPALSILGAGGVGEWAEWGGERAEEGEDQAW